MFKVYYFKKLKSTNDKAKELSENCVVLAEIQTKGRGRFNRRWSSSKGGLWMSIVLKPRIKNPKKITFIISIVIQKVLKKIFKLKTRIKWPNDIIFNGKKLCGILTETTFKEGKIDKMVVGIGLNVNNKLPVELRKKAASLKEIINMSEIAKGVHSGSLVQRKPAISEHAQKSLIFDKKINTKQLANEILKEFLAQYKRYVGNNKLLLTDWKKLSDTIGKYVGVKTIGKTYYGNAEDIDEDCSLIIKLKNNKIKKIIEGDLFYQKGSSLISFYHKF